MCGWAVWKQCRAGVQMGVQTCGHVNVDGCKQKRKKENPNRGVKRVDGPVGMRACGWACSRVGMRMRMAVNKNEKGKKDKEKEKTY